MDVALLTQQGCSQRVADLLVAGCSKAKLEAALEAEQNLTHEAAIDVARMNLIGSLRIAGFTIPRKRGFYQVIGWKKPVEKLGCETWTGASRDTLDWVESLPVLGADADSIAWTNLGLVDGEQTKWHERSLGYVYCYELESAHTTGYRYTSPSGGQAIVLKRFVRRPRLKILQLSLTTHEIVRLARDLAPASLIAVKIVNAGPQLVQDLRQNRDLGAEVSRHREAVYECHRIAYRRDEWASKRLQSTLRKGEREIDYAYLMTPTDEDRAQMKQVVDVWREFNEIKHRQLAIRRDYASIDLGEALRMHLFLGTRDGLPVCIQVFSDVPDTGVTVLVTEKSLNYRAMPGGRFGTADFNTTAACRFFADHPGFGVTHVNAGTYEGGGIGLADHKDRYATPELDETSMTVRLGGIEWKEE